MRSVARLRLHRSTAAACFVVWRKFGRAAFWDFCNTICQNWTHALRKREAYSITASARPSNGRTRLATVDQLLRKAPAVLDASGTPDGLNNLGGVISWIKSLSASVSNGLRSILKFEGAAVAASL